MFPCSSPASRRRARSPTRASPDLRRPTSGIRWPKGSPASAPPQVPLRRPQVPLRPLVERSLLFIVVMPAVAGAHQRW
jgi:hypothetical protein